MEQKLEFKNNNFGNYILSKSLKGNPKDNVCTWDSRKRVGDSPTSKLTILMIECLTVCGMQKGKSATYQTSGSEGHVICH